MAVHPTRRIDSGEFRRLERTTGPRVPVNDSGRRQSQSIGARIWQCLFALFWFPLWLSRSCEGSSDRGLRASQKRVSPHLKAAEGGCKTWRLTRLGVPHWKPAGRHAEQFNCCAMAALSFCTHSFGTPHWHSCPWLRMCLGRNNRRPTKMRGYEIDWSVRLGYHIHRGHGHF